METDVNGCSTCPAGLESYDTFKAGGKTYYQYDYRKPTGELFSCVAPSLEKCRARRDEWLSKNMGE